MQIRIVVIIWFVFCLCQLIVNSIESKYENDFSFCCHHVFIFKCFSLCRIEDVIRKKLCSCEQWARNAKTTSFKGNHLCVCSNDFTWMITKSWCAGRWTVKRSKQWSFVIHRLKIYGFGVGAQTQFIGRTFQLLPIEISFHYHYYYLRKWSHLYGRNLYMENLRNHRLNANREHRPTLAELTFKYTRKKQKFYAQCLAIAINLKVINTSSSFTIQRFVFELNARTYRPQSLYNPFMFLRFTILSLTQKLAPI